MVLYVKSGCGWCIDAEEWLQERQIPYKRIDVLKDREAYARMREISGQSLAPTLEMPDGEVLADFGVPELIRFLKARD